MSSREGKENLYKHLYMSDREGKENFWLGYCYRSNT
jgi:hypothetical protein